MAKKSCVFCNRSPVTKEHLFPAWVGRALRKDPKWKSRMPGRRGYKSNEKVSEWVSDLPIEMVVRCVCSECNSGWMSDIESAARPTLVKMILGEDVVELDQTTQQAVATWACLKTLIAHCVRPSHPITRAWFEHLSSDQTPPDGWEVFTTRYSGRVGQLMDSGRFSLRIAETGVTLQTRADEQGVLMTIVIGHFAVHSRGITPSILGTTRSNTLRIWPSSPLVLIWPPHFQIGDGRGLESFRRFGFDPASPPSFTLPA